MTYVTLTRNTYTKTLTQITHANFHLLQGASLTPHKRDEKNSLKWMPEPTFFT